MSQIQQKSIETQKCTLPKGAWPVMITPYRDDLSIDWEGVDRLVEWYLQAGACGLFAVCLSSEMLNLTPDERIGLARRVISRVAGRVPVIVSGTQGDTQEDTAEMTAKFAAAGAAAVVCTANQFAGRDEGDDVWRHAVESYLKLIDASIPLGIYECPHPYHRLVSDKQLGWLAATGRFVCLKDTSCATAPITAKLAVTRELADFRFYNANVPTLVSSLRAGGHGFSGIGANFCPELFAWLCANFDTQPHIADELQDFINIIGPLIVHKYPVSSKVFLKMEGFDIRPHSRVTRPVFTEEELLMLHSLRHQIQGWRERLTLPLPIAV